MNYISDLSVSAPIIIVTIGAALVLLFTVAGGMNRSNPAQVVPNAPANDTHLIVLSLASLSLAGYLLFKQENAVMAFSGALAVDSIGIVFGLVAVVGAFLAVILSAPYLREQGQSAGEFYALILLGTVGMLILAMAGDLMTLFIGIETMSLAVYVLAGFRRNSRRSQEAALKYFVYGAFASAFVLFGIALLYGEVGRVLNTPSVRFTALTQAFAGNTSVLGWVAVALVLSGLAFKVAAVPFHMWAPDVYEGAPTPATGFMAVGVKAAAFAGVCRFVLATVMANKHPTETIIQVFELLAILTMVVGNFLAIRQTQLKRMLAYSSIAHAGYIFVAIAALVAKPDSVALSAIAYYLFGYTAMTLGAFGVVLAFERRDDSRRELSIETLAGIGQRYPALALAMTVFMFSLAGVPPTAGFFGKLALFSAAVDAGRTPVVVVAVLASAVGAYYYLRVLVTMYMRQATGEHARLSSPWLSAGLWLCVILTLGLGVLPDGYFAYVKRVFSWLA